MMATAATVALLAGMPMRLTAAQELGAAVVPTTTAQDLVGTWRLLSIEIEGPTGRTSDPFYNQVGSGLLIYDQSGWVSVQIVASTRPKLDAPASRRKGAKGTGNSRLKAQLIDTYYAYFGTWEYDPQTSVVTHQVKSALYPGEEGARYAQQVKLEGTRMIFTREVTSGVGRTVQKKIWERVAPLPLAAH
jgi:Lipocalin-like domain